MATKKQSTRGRKSNKLKLDESLSAGPLTDEEKSFISENYNIITVNKICKELGRNILDLAVPIVEDYIKSIKSWRPLINKIQKGKIKEGQIGKLIDNEKGEKEFIPDKDLNNTDTNDNHENDDDDDDLITDSENGYTINFNSTYYEEKIEELLNKYKIFNTTHYVTKEKILLYFKDKSKAFTKNEFIKLVMMFSDVSEQYKEELNSSDFQSCLQLCSTQVLLDRQDLLEKLNSLSFSAKTRSELLKNITKLREELSISRQERLKKDTNQTANIAQLSENFNKDKFKKILQTEDNKDALDLLSFNERVNKMMSANEENHVPSVDDNIMFLGVQNEDINKLIPKEFSKEAEESLSSLSKLEDIILRDIHLNKDILLKKIQEKCPNLYNIFINKLTALNNAS